jgi:integrase/recombinase XerD
VSKPTAKPLAYWVQHFFVERLQNQQGVSRHTVASYRDTFRLLFSFIEKLTQRPACRQQFADWNGRNLLKFLDHLERERKSQVRTRNTRLAAIRAFIRYVAEQEPSHLAEIQQILAIPMKRFERPLLGYFTAQEIEAILDTTDDTFSGRRDHLLFCLLYNTGARVSEMIAVQRQQIQLGPMTLIALLGKGRKQRSVPLWKTTARQLKTYLQGLSTDDQTYLFTNRFGAPLSRSGVEKRLRLAICKAKTKCRSLERTGLSPHTFRQNAGLRNMPGGTDPV